MKDSSSLRDMRSFGIINAKTRKKKGHRMKNLFITLLLVISFLSRLEAQEIIENPEKPLSKNAGRILDLKEELRITDPVKIVTFLFSGELLDDITLHESFWFQDFQFLKDQRFFFFKNDRPETGDKPGVFDAPHVLISMDKNSQNIEEHLSLPYQFFMTGGASSGLGRITSIPYKNKFLFIANTEEYLVKLYDIESHKILRSFSRKYKRVKPPEDYRWGGIYSRDGQRMGPPPPKFFNDISALYIVNDKLWVRTSTRDEEKGYLIDVFEFDGQFVDSFYLKTEVRGIISTCGDLIFTRETDENELVTVVKYRIVE